ncbi:MAG: 50S ribosomal protein L10, partial [Acidilobaceae archaeon]|nr:50S ribosomal protein L10 [Acidilobaceae archaeon]
MMAKGRARVSPRKLEMASEIKDLYKKYKVMAIADVSKVPTAQLQQIRRKLRDQVEFKVVKKRVALKALEELGVEAQSLEKYVQGTVMLAFSDLNPFQLYKLVTRERIPIEAKPGQRVEKEVVIPAGETPITPGPMLGVLGKLKIPYEVKGGKVHVRKDTVVAKPGDVISPELASILLKLNVKPFEVGIDLIAAMDGGVVIPKESLKIDVEAFRKELSDAASEAIRLAVGIGYIEVPEALQSLLATAAMEAERLAEAAFIPLPGLIEPAVRRALQEEAALIALLGERAKELGLEPVAAPAAAPAAQPVAEQKKEEKREEEEKKEEEVDISAGLEGLFGF